MMLSTDGYQEFCLRDESYSCDSLKPCGLVARVVVFFFFQLFQPPFKRDQRSRIRIGGGFSHRILAKS